MAELEAKAAGKPTAAAAVPTPASKAPPTMSAAQAHAVLSPIGGIAESGAGMMQQFVLGPLSGLLGAIKLGTSGGNGQEAAQKVKDVQAWGYKPRVETAGTMLLKKAAPTVEHVAQWLDDGFYAMAGGHPVVATAGKSLVEGALTALGMKGLKPTGKILNAAAETANMEKNLQGLASIGVTGEKGGWKSSPVPEPVSVPDATVRAAKNITGDPRRGALLQETLNLLDNAKKTSKKAMDTAWKSFRDIYGDVQVDGKPFAVLAKDMRASLTERGFDPKVSPRTEALLNDIENLSTSKTPAVVNYISGQTMFPDRALATIRDLDILRRRASVKAVGRAATADEASLGHLRTMLEDSLDNIFEQSAKTAGKAFTTGAQDEARIRGMVESWKTARATSKDYYSKFAGPQAAQKQVVRLLRESATPEDVWSYVVGANALTNKLGGVNVIKHIKKILGEGSPAITDLRQAAIRDITKPLLGEKYDFPGLVKNIDNALNNKYSLLQELGISKDQLVNLRKAAVISEEMIKRNPGKFDARYITSQTGALFFGNGMAHNAAVIRLYRRLVGNKLQDIENKMTLKDMLRKGPDVPIVQQSPEALNYLAGVAAGNVPQAVTTDDEE